MPPIKDFWKHRKTTFVVDWEDTNLPYTHRGPRRNGTFKMRGLLATWLWAQTYCFFHTRGAVQLSFEEAKAPTNTNEAALP